MFDRALAEIFYRDDAGKEILFRMAKGDADVAFLSSGAYMVYGKKEDVRLLAMPERSGVNYYFSYVIVPCTSRIESLAELRGRVAVCGYLFFGA